MTVSGSLTIPSRTAAIDDARSWLRGHLLPEGATADAMWQIELALTEALANVMQHAYGGDESRSVGITLSADDDRVEIEIVDTGEPFDPEIYTEPRFDAPPAAGGYGIHLIGELVDEIEREPNGDRGTRLRLIKRGWRRSA